MLRYIAYSDGPQQLNHEHDGPVGPDSQIVIKQTMHCKTVMLS